MPRMTSPVPQNPTAQWMKGNPHFLAGQHVLLMDVHHSVNNKKAIVIERIKETLHWRLLLESPDAKQRELIVSGYKIIPCTW